MNVQTDNLLQTETDSMANAASISRRDFLFTLAGLPVLAALPFEVDARASATSRTPKLQHAVNQYIQTLRRQGRIPRNERTAWSIYDFTTQQKLVAINEDVPLQSASMMKPFIALAYFYRHQENPRRYPYDARIKYLMEQMIRKSSNTATNELINRISRATTVRKPKDVEHLLKRHAGGIFQQTSIVEYIPSNGRAYRNKSSAHDYSRFLYALWYNRLPYAPELKRHMGLHNDDRIRKGARAVSATTRVYDKTGSTARLCGNMGILVALGKDGKTYPYTFIGIIEKTRRTQSYGQWIRDRGNVLREVSSLVYLDMKKRHRLL